jgi:hypothetical protein
VTVPPVPPVPPVPTVPLAGESQVVAAARRALEQRAAAVRAAATTVGAPGAGHSGGAPGAAWAPRRYAGDAATAVMGAMGVTGLHYRDVRLVGAGDGPGRRGGAATTLGGDSAAGREVEVEATARYRVDGYDRVDREDLRRLTLVRDPGGWRVAVDAPAAGARTTPWDVPGAGVTRGDRSLVVGALDPADGASYARMADAAVAAVDRAWGRSWSRRLLVVVAPDGAAVAQQVGGSADLGQLAAVTDGPLASDGRAAGDRVVVDRSVMDGLAPAGRQFVLTHEAVHVALRSALAGRPARWVSEGFADRVGYAGTDLPPRRVAAGLLDDVAAGRGPTRLPTDSDFDPGRGDLPPVYAAAWLAVEEVAARGGPGAVPRFVVAATSTGSAEDRDAATRRAFRDVLGTGEEDFTGLWRQRLADLADATAR